VKYLPLIWSGIWRRRGRAVLMLLQIVSAFTLFGVLQGLNSGIKQAIASTHGDRLYITSSVSVGDPLPIGLLPRIRATPGVRIATQRAVLIGTYMKPDQGVPVIAGDVEALLRVYDELSVSPPDAIKVLKSTRTGAIVGSDLVKRYGWKIGDRFVLQSSTLKRDGSRNWAFDVVGVFQAPKDSIGSPPAVAAIGNFDYLNEARATDVDRADMFIARIGDAKEAAAVALAIDNAFANSEHETHTQSEGDLVATQLQQTVDLDFIVRGIVAAVFFALLLAIGALMMLSLRERTPELAVLKTVGFSDRRISLLLLAESITFCLLAAAIGLAVGTTLLLLSRSLVGIARMPLIVILAGLACALLLALIAGAAPALRGSRLQVADALAGR
jgi:putative ABC transport system permease protein